MKTAVSSTTSFFIACRRRYFLFASTRRTRIKTFIGSSARPASAAVEVENVSAKYAQLALQGPRAEKILEPLTALDLGGLKSFYFAFADVAGARCLVARTGYTGEDGFELYCNADDAVRLWDALLDAGAPDGLCLAGLGARDTLRLEKGYPLYGHELDDTTTPLEAGLAWVTKFSKPNFIGRDILMRQKEIGVKRKLVGLEMIEPGIARSGYGLFKRRTIDWPGHQRHQVAVSRQIDRARLRGIGRVGARECRRCGNSRPARAGESRFDTVLQPLIARR